MIKAHLNCTHLTLLHRKTYKQVNLLFLRQMFHYMFTYNICVSDIFCTFPWIKEKKIPPLLFSSCISDLSCLHRHNRHGGMGAPWGLPAPLPPPPPRTKLPQLQAWPSNLASSLGRIAYPVLGLPGPVWAHRASICVQSKVTFVNAIGSCGD